ncbi:site-specific integrase [Roseivirga sp. 4D4]|uniref:site-specific integrase n=1 Tax=Roseivirga sp. 4D4 TaxID=1889784 RepID=UPI000AE14E8F|nr:site-specific integrase [Roseivirga sp. 4D4]
MVHRRSIGLGKNYVYQRGGKFIYRRRVPSEVSHLDTRKEVKISLKTHSYQEAVIRSTIYDRQVQKFWNDLIETQSSNNLESRYKKAVRTARANGFSYKSIEELATLDLNEIVERLLVDIDQKEKAEALLGGAGSSKVKLTQCSELYWGLVHDQLVNKSPHQIRKWKNPRKAALDSFISVVGDKYLQQITRKDILSFRSWLNDKLRLGFSPSSANKQMRFVRHIIQQIAISQELEIDFDPLFAKLNFKLSNISRPPFEASYVQNKLLPNLGFLNERDRLVVMAIADTGARISEVFGLRPEDIRLEEDIPFIWIRARKGYELKTESSERKIPLVGTALQAFSNSPGGFNHSGNPDSFSGNVNKRLSNHGLRPTPQHSIYSLRHTFKDRLRDIEAPEEIIDDLMGHKKSGPKYGRGHRLETKLKWLEKIAYRTES